MARPGLRNHPKFKRCCHTLKVPPPHLLGYLECMWGVGNECGDPYIGDPLDIELAAEYPGDPGTLFDVLLNCGGEGRAGFIEECPDRPGKYQIHDLFDHCPEYVKKRHARERERKDKGLRPKPADNGGQRPTTADDGGRWTPSPSSQDENGDTPAPAPAPALNSNTPAAQAPAAPVRGQKRPARPVAAPKPEHGQFLAHFKTAWRDRYGLDYATTDHGREGRDAKQILDALDRDLSRASAVADAYLADDDSWLTKYRHPLQHLVGRLNAYTDVADGAYVEPTAEQVAAFASPAPEVVG